MNLYELRREFAESGIMMCFNGPFSHSIIEEIGIALRNHLAAENIAQAAVLDVFAVYIELAQNVRNYLTLRDITQSESGSSIITIARWGNGYMVSSGNIIQNNDTEPLCKRIDELNAMTPEERKRRYRERMRGEIKPTEMGAGLGLFEIAKRSSAALTYSIRKVDDHHGFFSLTVFI